MGIGGGCLPTQMIDRQLPENLRWLWAKRPPQRRNRPRAQRERLPGGVRLLDVEAHAGRGHLSLEEGERDLTVVGLAEREARKQHRVRALEPLLQRLAHRGPSGGLRALVVGERKPHWN